MTIKTYKGYTIRITGLSHHIYRPGTVLKTTFGYFYSCPEYAPGYSQSFAAAKRWINEDIARQQATTDFSSITFKGKTQCR